MKSIKEAGDSVSEATIKAKTLGEYLKSRRERLQPEQVSLKVHGQRRTPGLRREEVALLAGVSVTYYTWLEQGRSVTASREVIQSLARALQLSPEERAHLVHLWDPHEEERRNDRPSATGLEMLQSSVDAFACPAFVTNERTELLAWNQEAERWLTDFGAMAPERRVFIQLLFTAPAFRERIVNWESFVQFAVPVFRTYCDQHADDPWYEKAAAELREASSAFSQLWDRYEIGVRNVSRVMLRHPETTEPTAFEVQSWSTVAQGENVHMCLYTPVRSSAS